MKHRRRFFISLGILLASCFGDIRAQRVSLLDDGQSFPIEPQQTQTEVKPGWKIVDIQLKSTLQRYLWGEHAREYTVFQRPKFIVDTDTLLLSNMVLIKLKARREYRRIPKAYVYDNKCVYVDLNNFAIDAYGQDSFLIQPAYALEPGEYIFTWTTGRTVGELDDWIVWPFSVR